MINGGTLVVNGSIASPVLVNSGGTLRGTGVINAALSNSGTVSPGNSGGTLSVNGNFTQGPTGTFQTQLDQTGAHTSSADAWWIDSMMLHNTSHLNASAATARSCCSRVTQYWVTSSIACAESCGASVSRARKYASPAGSTHV